MTTIELLKHKRQELINRRVQTMGHLKRARLQAHINALTDEINAWEETNNASNSTANTSI